MPTPPGISPALPLTLLLLFLHPAGLTGQAPDSAPDPAPDPERELPPLSSRYFPSEVLVPGFLANMKEPGFYGGLRAAEFDRPTELTRGERSITTAVAAIGGSFGLWSLDRADREGEREGLRLDLFASTFSQFNLSVSSADLLNTDFVVGPALTARTGAWSGRFRLYHQSSHVGDELLLAEPELERVNLSFEAVDLMAIRSFALGPVRGRVYAGGGSILGSDTDLDRGILEWGFEVEAREAFDFVGTTRLLPVLGTHLQAFEVRDWGTTTSLKGGIEWRSPEGGPRLRLLGVFLDGFIPFGQFFTDTELTNVGAELQLVL